MSAMSREMGYCQFNEKEHFDIEVRKVERCYITEGSPSLPTSPSNVSKAFLKCRVHNSKEIKHLCLD